MIKQSRRKGRALRLGAIALVGLLCSSCFTTAVWAPEVQGPRYGVPERVCLTPFALVLDLLTWPLQEAFWRGEFGCH